MELLIILIGGIIGAKLFSKNNKISQNRDPFYQYNNPTLKENKRYVTHCWNCGKKIDSFYDTKCNYCGWYKCSNCGACSKHPNCEERRSKNDKY